MDGQMDKQGEPNNNKHHDNILFTLITNNRCYVAANNKTATNSIQFISIAGS